MYFQLVQDVDAAVGTFRPNHRGKALLMPSKTERLVLHHVDETLLRIPAERIAVNCDVDPICVISVGPIHRDVEIEFSAC